MPSRQFIAAYMPVLHRGYLNFFKAYPATDACYFFDEKLLEQVDYLRKDLRALSPNQQVQVISALKYFKKVQKLTSGLLRSLDCDGTTFIMPDEDISREISKQLARARVEFYPVFLRWDRSSVEGIDAKDPDEAVTSARFHQQMIKKAMSQAGRSPDIWRRLGGVLVGADKKMIAMAFNQGEPTGHSPWMEGDPRNIFNRGVAIEMSIYTHAEAALIAEAARAGIKLEGGAIYITTFPCPACAKLIAHSGLRTCYYKDGYAVLDGKRVMQEYGVKTVRVLIPDDIPEHPATKVPYKKS